MTEIVPSAAEFELDQRRAKAYAESGYWPDMKSLAQAFVKIEAGRALGLPALVAMTEIHVIDGKPTLGAGALSAKVKASGKYDYRVVALNNEGCRLAFYDRGEHVGDSTFTLDDAKTAKLTNKGPWSMYPRNMLFARAMSNGVAWFCPDILMGRVYDPSEIDDAAAPPPLPEELNGDVVAALVEELDAVEVLEDDLDADFGPAPPTPIDEDDPRPNPQEGKRSAAEVAPYVPPPGELYGTT